MEEFLKEYGPTFISWIESQTKLNNEITKTIGPAFVSWSKWDSLYKQKKVNILNEKQMDDRDITFGDVSTNKKSSSSKEKEKTKKSSNSSSSKKESNGSAKRKKENQVPLDEPIQVSINNFCRMLEGYTDFNQVSKNRCKHPWTNRADAILEYHEIPVRGFYTDKVRQIARIYKKIDYTIFDVLSTTTDSKGKQMVRVRYRNDEEETIPLNDFLKYSTKRVLDKYVENFSENRNQKEPVQQRKKLIAPRVTFKDTESKDNKEIEQQKQESGKDEIEPEIEPVEENEPEEPVEEDESEKQPSKKVGPPPQQRRRIQEKVPNGDGDNFRATTHDQDSKSKKFVYRPNEEGNAKAQERSSSESEEGQGEGEGQEEEEEGPCSLPA
jgi:hypothetical protein